MPLQWLNFLNQKNYRRIKDFVGGRLILALTVGFFLGFAAFAMELGIAFALQSFLVSIGLVNKGLVRFPAWYPQDNFIFVLSVLTGLGTLRAIVNGAQTYLNSFLSEQFIERQRSQVLTWAFNERGVGSGEATTLFSDSVYKASQALVCFQGLALQGALTLLIFISLLKIDVRLSIILMIFLGVLGGLLSLVNKKAENLGKDILRLTQPLQSHILRSLKNILLLDIYGTSKKEEEFARAGTRQMFEIHMRYYKYSAFRSSFPQALGAVFLSVIAILGVKTIRVEPSLLLAYVYLFSRFVTNLSTFSTLTSGFELYWPFLDNMASWWEEHRGFLERHKAAISADILSNKPFRSVADPYGFVFKRVTFAYSPTERNLFKDFDLSVNPGSCVVITGPSGAGKSTFLSLLLGLVSPTEGSIETFSGNESHQIVSNRSSEFLRALGYVGPDSFMIDGTIRANLTYGLYRSPTEAEIQSALERSESEFVLDLPGKLEYVLAETGAGLSAGQKQRLALARALLRDPKVLILDEATSNLDAAVERRLVEIWSRLKGSVTIIAVTHREELLRIADRHIHLEGPRTPTKT